MGNRPLRSQKALLDVWNLYSEPQNTVNVSTWRQCCTRQPTPLLPRSLPLYNTQEETRNVILGEKEGRGQATHALLLRVFTEGASGVMCGERLDSHMERHQQREIITEQDLWGRHSTDPLPPRPLPASYRRKVFISQASPESQKPGSKWMI